MSDHFKITPLFLWHIS